MRFSCKNCARTLGVIVLGILAAALLVRALAALVEAIAALVLAAIAAALVFPGGIRKNLLRMRLEGARLMREIQKLFRQENSERKEDP